MIPLVVHHGRSRWTRPARLPELIDPGPAARQAMLAYLPRFEFLLDDLARVDGRQLRDRDLTPPALITLLLLKTAAGNPGSPLSCGRCGRSWTGPAAARRSSRS